jgi:hypothetical protein
VNSFNDLVMLMNANIYVFRDTSMELKLNSSASWKDGVIIKMSSNWDGLVIVCLVMLLNACFTKAFGDALK